MKFTMDLGRFTDLRACVIVGGDSMDSQFADLARNPDMLVFGIYYLNNIY